MTSIPSPLSATIRGRSYLADEDLNDKAWATAKMLRFSTGVPVRRLAEDLISYAKRISPESCNEIWRVLHAVNGLAIEPKDIDCICAATEAVSRRMNKMDIPSNARWQISLLKVNLPSPLRELIEHGMAMLVSRADTGDCQLLWSKLVGGVASSDAEFEAILPVLSVLASRLPESFIRAEIAKSIGAFGKDGRPEGLRAEHQRLRALGSKLNETELSAVQDSCVRALAEPRMSPEQEWIVRTHVKLAAIIGRPPSAVLLVNLNRVLEASSNHSSEALAACCELAEVVAPTLDSKLSNQLARSLRQYLDHPRSNAPRDNALNAIEALLPSLEGKEFNAAFDVYCMELNRASLDGERRSPAQRLDQWRNRLTSTQSEAAVVALLAGFSPDVLNAESSWRLNGIKLLAPQLDLLQTDRIAERICEKGLRDSRRTVGPNALVLLAKLDSPAALKVFDRVEKSVRRNLVPSTAWYDVFKAVAPRLSGNDAVRILRFPSDSSQARDYREYLFPSLADRLSPAQLKQAMINLRRIKFEFPNAYEFMDDDAVGAWKYVGVFDDSEVEAEFGHYLAFLRRPVRPYTVEVEWAIEMLTALSATGKVRDSNRRLIATLQGMLDLELPWQDSGNIPQNLSQIARGVDDPRIIADFLAKSHSDEETRRGFLSRFEELTIHKDKPLPQPQAFFTVHDAAAWIEKNWPDFDLE